MDRVCRSFLLVFAVEGDVLLLGLPRGGGSGVLPSRIGLAGRTKAVVLPGQRRRLGPPRSARAHVVSARRVPAGGRLKDAPPVRASLDRLGGDDASRVGALAVLDLDLRAADDVVDAAADVLDLVLAVKVPLDDLVGLDKVLELLLEAVVLVVQVGHVPVEGVDLRLEVGLVAQHLVGVLLEAVDLEGNRLLVLLELAERDLLLLAPEPAILADDILVLVRLEELALGGLVLLVQALEVAQLAVELVQGVLEVLDRGVRVGELHEDGLEVVFLVREEALHGEQPLVIVLEVSPQDVVRLPQLLAVAVKRVAGVPEADELAVVGVADLLLVGNHHLDMLYLLAEIQIHHVDRAGLVAQVDQLIVRRLDILL